MDRHHGLVIVITEFLYLDNLLTRSLCKKGVRIPKG